MPLSQESVVRTLFAARHRVTAAVWLLTRDSGSAEDIFQNVSVKALSGSATFEHEGQLLSWAHVVARHEALDWMRRRRPEISVLDEDVLELIEREWTAAPLISGGKVDALRSCLERTPPDSRHLLELRYFEGRSCEEVSQILGVSLDAVYQRLSRLHRQLKSCIEEHLPPASSMATGPAPA